MSISATQLVKMTVLTATKVVWFPRIVKKLWNTFTVKKRQTLWSCNPSHRCDNFRTNALFKRPSLEMKGPPQFEDQRKSEKNWLLRTFAIIKPCFERLYCRKLQTSFLLNHSALCGTGNHCATIFKRWKFSTALKWGKFSFWHGYFFFWPHRLCVR